MTLFIFTAGAGLLVLSMTTGNKDSQKCELAFTSYNSTVVSEVNAENNSGHHDLKSVDHRGLLQSQSSLTGCIWECFCTCDWSKSRSDITSFSSTLRCKRVVSSVNFMVRQRIQTAPPMSQCNTPVPFFLPLSLLYSCFCPPRWIFPRLYYFSFIYKNIYNIYLVTKFISCLSAWSGPSWLTVETEHYKNRTWNPLKAKLKHLCKNAKTASKTLGRKEW